MHEDDSEEPGAVTGALRGALAGDAEAEERLWSLVYDELRAIAGRLMRAELAGTTLQPTAVVHETYVRLFEGQTPDLQDRRHFLGVAARIMRQLLVDRARERRAAKRGGEWSRVTLTDRLGGESGMEVDVLDLHEALERLAKLKQRHARVVELRYFGGMSIEETAEHLGIGTTTVKADWIGARAWLLRELTPR